jgi:hypothetical protein
MQKIKLTDSERSILRELIFPESFGHLLTETGLSYGAIRDDLITLINLGFIEVYEDRTCNRVTPFYDSDQIDDFYYKATKRGLKSIQNYAI